MSRRRQQLGFRREVAAVLLLALFILVSVSAFTLFSYRSGIDLLIEERREEALARARAVADDLSSNGFGSPTGLRRLAPGARSLVVLDAGGRALLTSGESSTHALPAEIDLANLPERPAFGPSLDGAAGVIALAPFVHRGQRRFIQLELAADRLAAQRRGVRALVAVALAVDVAIVALLLFFLDRILGPYEALLRRARESEGPQSPDEDEMAFLLSTFERALSTLTGAGDDALDDEIGALQRTLTHSLESGVLILDRRQRLLAINRIGCSLLKIEPVEGPVDFRQGLASQVELVTALEAAVVDDRAIQRQEVPITLGEVRRTLGLSVHPLRQDNGEVRGYLGLFADLTEVNRKAEEQRLARSLSQLGEVTAGIAHELRNSLATLQGYLTLIERRPEDESIADYLAEIRAESDHLQRVLEDFLSFASPGSLRLRSVDLVSVARRIAADPQHRGAVAVEVDEGVPPIHADPDLVGRAIHNLVHNAVQAQTGIGVESPVRVRLAVGADGVRLTVDDRGPGLPEEIRERIFQPFVTDRPGGVGMGLAMAHRIVDLHGGRLRVDARDGGGVSAEILFPDGTLATIGSEPEADTPPRSTAQDDVRDS